MNNLEIWNKYKEVPANAQKEFDNGSFKGTDINTMWRIKSLTEQFGVCGFGWYYDIVKVWNEDTDDCCNNEVVTFAEIKLYIKMGSEWSKGISGVGGNKFVSYVKSKDYHKPSDEAVKMAVTDALGNACRNLGFGADIYWSNDKTKYSQSQEQEEIIGADFVMPVGKHKGESLDEIDPQYLRWFLDNGTDENIKANIREFFKPKEVEV